MKKVVEFFVKLFAITVEAAFEAYEQFLKPLYLLVLGIEWVLKKTWPYTKPVLLAIWMPFWALLWANDKFWTWLGPKIWYFFTFCWLCGHKDKVIDWHPNVLRPDELKKWPNGYSSINCQYCQRHLEVSH